MVEQEQFKEFGLVTISLRGQYILQMVVLIFIEIMSEWASFLIFSQSKQLLLNESVIV